MFSTIKHLVLGSALLASAAGAQAYTLTTTPPNSWASVKLTESSNLGKLSMHWYPITGNVAGLPGATLTKTGYGFAPSAIDLVLSAPITALTVDINATNPFELGGSQLTATQFSLGGGLSLAVGNTYTELTNLTIDLVNKQVRADVSSGNVHLPGMTVWTIDSIGGPSSLKALQCDLTCNFAATYLDNGYLQNRYLDNLTLSGLRMTQEATDLLMPVINTSTFGSMYQDYKYGASWDNQITFSAMAVPEAGTSLMMMLGLGALAFVRRPGSRAH
ncbi:MAG: hypothetical protein QM749_07205 [Aquabacterium sp.]